MLFSLLSCLCLCSTYSGIFLSVCLLHLANAKIYDWQLAYAQVHCNHFIVFELFACQSEKPNELRKYQMKLNCDWFCHIGHGHGHTHSYTLYKPPIRQTTNSIQTNYKSISNHKFQFQFHFRFVQNEIFSFVRLIEWNQQLTIGHCNDLWWIIST